VAVDDISWWTLLEQLLIENDPTITGERRAVLEYVAIYGRFAPQEEP
jgi:hypothetical protein